MLSSACSAVPPGPDLPRPDGVCFPARPLHIILPMEVKEHFYSDDPSRGPADGKTTLDGVEYFFLGNGRIQPISKATCCSIAT